VRRQGKVSELEVTYSGTGLGLTITKLGGGRSNREVAEILAVSHRTINRHLDPIYTKLGVKTDGGGDGGAGLGSPLRA
jgi:hypothetical protein